MKLHDLALVPIEGMEFPKRKPEKVKLIRENLKIAQNRQKSYADKRRIDLEFEIGDQVFLRLSPWKCVLRFGRKGGRNDYCKETVTRKVTSVL
ncbi:uncharacterized protein E6C27_scaffold55G00310 [Cucumis melo var. makuwa]|uniref:DNA/RNA polymerases superfamily protein n=1 Tax=Cucumis melo var. makuwa TaxID=1194695 RepID=A0A5A7UA67_CUCMM|nr:uncharacterized protein E6C27_scaffold55G00310 [Cucumis melo var. makuwa]